MLWSKSELLEALTDEILEQNLPDNLEIDEVVIDSRKTPKSGLFIALNGEINDGHDFLDQAATNGCKAAIIDNKSFLSSSPSCLLVKDTFKALYKLAEFSRKRSKAKIIGLTGSVGKTSTKDMLELVFSTQGKTFATPGNLNNHIGLPLSLCNFSRDCDYGIFEMGMNHAGEIEPLSKLAQPHLAIITNVAPVHIEFFKDEEGIAKAKSEIFSGLVGEKIALINFDNPHFSFLKQQANNLRTLSFGRKDGADYQILDDAVSAKLPSGKKITYKTNSSHSAVISNSIAVIACLDLFGNDFDKGIAALEKLESKQGRGKITKIGNITIIDESYNASLPSMRCGLEYASNLKRSLGKNRVVAVLGDMFELGDKSLELHEEVIRLLSEFNIDFAVLVGEKLTSAKNHLPKNSYKNFPDSLSVSLAIKDLLKDEDILYIKGSRGMKMEKIIEKLQSAY